MCPRVHLIGAPTRGLLWRASRHEEFYLSLVSHKPPGQSFAIDLAALGELAYDAAALISVLREPDLSLFVKQNDVFSSPDYVRKASRGVGAQPCSC